MNKQSGAQPWGMMTSNQSKDWDDRDAGHTDGKGEMRLKWSDDECDSMNMNTFKEDLMRFLCTPHWHILTFMGTIKTSIMISLLCHAHKIPLCLWISDG